MITNELHSFHDPDLRPGGIHYKVNMSVCIAIICIICRGICPKYEIDPGCKIMESFRSYPVSIVWMQMFMWMKKLASRNKIMRAMEEAKDCFFNWDRRWVWLCLGDMKNWQMVDQSKPWMLDTKRKNMGIRDVLPIENEKLDVGGSVLLGSKDKRGFVHSLWFVQTVLTITLIILYKLSYS